jgi:hypothetical protein
MQREDEACLYSAFFKLIREAASSQLAFEEVEYALDLGLDFAPTLLAIVF